jgi:hypothetical protein
MWKAMKTAPLPIVLLVVSLVCPTELSLFLGGMRLPPHRVALIILVIAALIRMSRAKPIKLMACDGLMLLYGLWSIGIFMFHEGQGPGLQYGGSLALESFAAYFVARVYITTIDHLKSCVSLLLFCVIVIGAIAAMESISHTLIVHSFLKQVTGHDVEPGFEIRRGLMRAYSTFDHPILYGSFCASIIALSWATAKNMGLAQRNVALIAAATYFGMSSAPLLCIGVQTFLLVWERLSRGIPRRATVTVGVLVLALFALGFASNRSPFAIIATGFTLDPWTGFYRLLIWEHGLNNVAMAPMTGIGLKDWVREWWMASDSVDAFWLVIMMRMGVPALALLVLAMTLLLVAIHQQKVGMTKEIRRLVIAWTFSVLALSLAGCTVHYWNNLHAYFFFTLGMMAWVGDSKIARKRAHAFARIAAKKAGSVAVRQPAKPAIDPPMGPPIGPGHNGPGRSTDRPLPGMPSSVVPYPGMKQPHTFPQYRPAGLGEGLHAAHAQQPNGVRPPPQHSPPPPGFNRPLAVGTYVVV